MPDVGAQSMLGGWALSHGANESTGWCYDFLVGDPIDKSLGSYSPEGWYNLGFCAMQFVSVVGLLLVIWCNDRAARRGNYKATKRLILPVYHQIVYALVLFEGLAILFVVLRLGGKAFEDCEGSGDAGCMDGSRDRLVSIKAALIGLDWGLLHWIIDGVAVFLCQTSAGKRAMKQAVTVGFVPAALSFAMGYLKHRATVQPHDPCTRETPACTEGSCGSADPTTGPGPSHLSCLYLPMAYQVFLLLVYMRVWLAPGRQVWVFPRVYRREAAIAYVRFWSIFRVLTLMSSLCLIQPFFPKLVDFGFCMDFSVEVFVFALAKAVVIYNALRQDSAFWQCETPAMDPNSGSQSASGSVRRRGAKRSKSSMARSAVAGTSALEDGFSLNSPLVGQVDIEHADAEVINAELEKVQNSIVIPYGFLQLNKADVLGYGGTARVYRAKLHDQTVAAKVMFCPSIEPAMVRNFFKEARILKEVEHPNIVSLCGVCCLPPTVCIVMELCIGGSLTDWLATRRQRWFPSVAVEDTRASLSAFESRWWKPLCQLMMDAAAGVAQIHKHSMVHLDIKSMNFLVALRTNGHGVGSSVATAGGNSIPKTSSEIEEEQLPLDQRQNPNVIVKLADLENVAITANFGHEFRNSNRRSRFHTSTTEIEVPDTLDWTAPELLSQGGSAASAASDVYALTMTMWEVATCGVENPGQALEMPTPHSEAETTRAPDVRERILAGWRPSFDGTGIPDQLLHNLQMGWGAEPANRPTADNLRQAVDAYVVGRESGDFTVAAYSPPFDG